METLVRIYGKCRNYVENGIFVIILAYYPLTKINQGLDVVDSSYSLGNFLFFKDADGVWMVAIYLANVLGWLLMKLPRGDTLIGMNLYTGLILSAIALLSYFCLRKRLPAWIVFFGEMIALGLCWCPTVILYNYLTYLFMAAAVFLLHKGIMTDGKGYAPWLFAAGICLGANIAVRMPNVVQAAFILALWYAAWLKKEKAAKCIKDTMICIAGYITGFAVPFVSICIKYGMAAYPDMIQSMFAMTDKAADYKPAAMLGGMFADYIKGMYWLAFAVGCIAILYIILILKNRFVPNKGKSLFVILCAAVCLVLIRFYWGRGMFDFRYYYYGSIYQWAVLFLILTAGLAVYVIVSPNRSMYDKVLAMLILIQMFVTPLGSNNELYPIINNLFIAAPFTLWTGFGLIIGCGHKEVHLPWKTMLVTLILMLFIQSIGFHFNFAFNDGVWGEERDTLVERIPKAEGIYTNRDNAEQFAELTAYADTKGFSGRSVILYGEIPGLSYFLDMPTAISTSWPDLDSNRLEQFEADIEKVEKVMEADRPIIIVSAAISAYKSEDAEAYKWFGVNEEKYKKDDKLNALLRFIDKYEYEETFCNMKYAVYE